MRFVFYDYETFGIDPARDRIAQFAAVVTDEYFNIIEEPVSIFCKQYMDYLPSPIATMVTSITPQQCSENGLDEKDFAAKICELFSKENSCILGYNNIRFDDEMTRYLLYRNFFDPYEYSYKNGNSRWDLIDLVRACYALRPEGINWVFDENNNPVFKLDQLTVANNIAHENAHDALSDVYATIEMAKLIKQKQPKLFDYFFNLRQTKAMQYQFGDKFFTPLVHISGMFGNVRANASLVCPIDFHPTRKNSLILCDLNSDISDLITESADVLREHLYTKKETLQEQNINKVPLKMVHFNKCPVLAPHKTLSEQRANQIGVDLALCHKNLQILIENKPLICEKINLIFEGEQEFAVDEDVQTQLYNGFFDFADKQNMAILRTFDEQALATHKLSFNDERVEDLLFYYRAKNYPKTLNDYEKERWIGYCKEKFDAKKDLFKEELEQMFEQYQDDSEKLAILEQVADYYDLLFEKTRVKIKKVSGENQQKICKVEDIVNQNLDKNEKFNALRDLLGN